MPLDKIQILQDRGAMLAEARAYFAARNVLEVDCPAISHAASLDVHIDLMPVLVQGGKTAYLHTSPEYGMKRLLADGIGDIYQLSHVFRDGEFGPRHNPEFTMTEWYRMGISFDAFIEEVLDFIRLFVSDLPATRISYREALLRYAHIDYMHASIEDLRVAAQKYSAQTKESKQLWNREDLLQLLLNAAVEPHLGIDSLCVFTDYPASEAALARTYWKEDEHVAERFEIYYKGVELANGYHELADPIEQRKRFEETEEMRRALGKKPLPVDEHFLKALEKGLPDCCGVAVGFDRLLLLRHSKTSLAEVLPISWPDA